MPEAQPDKDLGACPGSRADASSPQAVSTEGFDPARIESALLSALDGNWRTLGSLGFSFNSQWLVAPARRLIYAGKVERRTGPRYVTLYRRAQ